VSTLFSRDGRTHLYKLNALVRCG